MKEPYYNSPSVLSWIKNILFERFEVLFTVSFDKSLNSISLRVPGAQGAIIFDRLNDNFGFSNLDQTCAWWKANEEGWTPVLKESLPAPGNTVLPYPLIEFDRTCNAYIHYDLCGLIYWTLCRIEEIEATQLDNHERFSVRNSHAFNNNYLNRPFIDEWLDILKQVCHKIWPGLITKIPVFSVLLSHDVDEPARYSFSSWKSVFRSVAIDLVRRKRLSSVIYGPLLRLRKNSNKLSKLDSVNTFDWIMDKSEQQGLTSAFYFIAGKTHPSNDATYDIEHPAIINLINHIHNRGHEIGLHPSYNTFNNIQAIVGESNRLRKLCLKQGINQDNWGGRMHYLRWRHPTTMFGWEAANMTYDSTLGYADLPGFRCGTCFEYPAFDPIERKPIALRLRPLIAMECSVMSPRYMGLGTGEEALAIFTDLKDKCKAVGGIYSLLWHNSHLETVAQKGLYSSILGH